MAPLISRPSRFTVRKHTVRFHLNTSFFGRAKKCEPRDGELAASYIWQDLSCHVRSSCTNVAFRRLVFLAGQGCFWCRVVTTRFVGVFSFILCTIMLAPTCWCRKQWFLRACFLVESPWLLPVYWALWGYVVSYLLSRTFVMHRAVSLIFFSWSRISLVGCLNLWMFLAVILTILLLSLWICYCV